MALNLPSCFKCVDSKFDMVKQGKTNLFSEHHDSALEKHFLPLRCILCSLKGISIFYSTIKERDCKSFPTNQFAITKRIKNSIMIIYRIKYTELLLLFLLFVNLACDDKQKNKQLLGYWCEYSQNTGYSEFLLTKDSIYSFSEIYLSPIVSGRIFLDNDSIYYNTEKDSWSMKVTDINDNQIFYFNSDGDTVKLYKLNSKDINFGIQDFSSKKGGDYEQFLFEFNKRRNDFVKKYGYENTNNDSSFFEIELIED